MVLSASSEAALRELSQVYAEHLAKEHEFLANICHTAAVGRSALAYRLAFTAPNTVVTKELLGAFAQQKSGSEIVSGRVRSDSRVAFLFTGQGAQYVGMGRDLYGIEPVFRDAFDQCAVLLGQHLDRPLQEIVGYNTKVPTPPGILDETRYTQPALFAVEYALASLWRSWGIEPAAIVGHSVGEYVGACISGALRLEDALGLVAMRSRLMQSLPRNGAMAAVFADEERVRAAIAPYNDSVSIAATNSPLNTVISGKVDEVRAVLEQLRQEGVESKSLTVSHAFHSPLLEPILGEFEQYARGIEYRMPNVDLVLNLTGRISDEATPINANYWRRHARETVRFAESIQSLHRLGIRAFLEIGPAPVLTGMARRCVEDPETIWLASLRKDRDDSIQMLSSLGALFVLGASPDWGAHDRPFRRHRVTLPTYAFQRKRHWFPIVSPRSTGKRPNTTGNPLLGKHMPLAGRPGEHVWLGKVSLELCPWIDDHRVLRVAVAPPAIYVEMVTAAAMEVFAELPVILKRIKIERALLLRPADEFEIQTHLEQVAGDMVFQVHSRRENSEGSWTLRASGTLQVGGIAPSEEKFDVSQGQAFEKRSVRCLDGPDFYRLHQERGNQWGPCFQGVGRVWQGRGEALSEVMAPFGIQAELSRYFFHPAFSDSLGQVLTATIPLEKTENSLGGAFLSAGVEEVRVHRRPEGSHFYAYAQLRSDKAASDNILVGDIKVFDLAGNLIIESIGTRLCYMDSAQKHDALESAEEWFYEPQWKIKEAAAELSPEVSVSGIWIIFRDQQGIGDAVCAQLRERGAKCLCVDQGEQRSQANHAFMTIRPDNADDYDGLLRAADQQGSVIIKIVHLWSLDAADLEKADLKDVEKAQLLGPVSTLRIVQALDRARLPEPPKLWLISRGAQPAGETANPLSVLQSPLWGLGRTIAMEHGDFWGGMVDLDPADSPAAAAALLIRQLSENDGEDQTAFRDGQRRVLRLARRMKTISKPRPVPVRPNATYLITGGLSRIGLIIAGWLADRGARHLILAGRNSLRDRQEWDDVASGTIEGARITAVRKLENLGVNVQTVGVSMGDEASVNGVIRQILSPDQPPLRGVFHAAGVTEYEALGNQTAERMREILAAKMVGAWLLHRLLADVPLELFVLFSSSSSLLSAPMLGSYSAANVFLDAIAHHRRATGKAALSVNWGAWSEAGMADLFRAKDESNLNIRTGATKGVGVLSTQRALEALELLLEDGAVQAGVMPIDWTSWQRFYGSLALSPYFSLLISGTIFGTPSKTAGAENREHIITARPDDRVKMLRDYLAGQMARILKVSLDSIESETPILNMGFDSLMSIELQNEIDKNLGVRVALSRLMQSPTLWELTDWVVQMLEAVQPVAASLAVDSPIGEFEEGVL
jgi:acyl transferase domain-containing protein/aryl carrier-like protein